MGQVTKITRVNEPQAWMGSGHSRQASGVNWLGNSIRRSPLPPIEIVDFYHACDHLKEGCDGAWGESSLAIKTHFERLKMLLKEAEDGANTKG